MIKQNYYKELFKKLTQKKKDIEALPITNPLNPEEGNSIELDGIGTKLGEIINKIELLPPKEKAVVAPAIELDGIGKNIKTQINAIELAPIKKAFVAPQIDLEEIGKKIRDKISTIQLLPKENKVGQLIDLDSIGKKIAEKISAIKLGSENKDQQGPTNDQKQMETGLEKKMEGSPDRDGKTKCAQYTFSFDKSSQKGGGKEKKSMANIEFIITLDVTKLSGEIKLIKDKNIGLDSNSTGIKAVTELLPIIEKYLNYLTVLIKHSDPDQSESSSTSLHSSVFAHSGGEVLNYNRIFSRNVKE